LKKNSNKIKRIIYPHLYLLLAISVLNLFVLTSFSIPASSDTKNAENNSASVLVIIEGVEKGPGEEVSLHLCEKLVINDFAITVAIIPYLNKKELTGSDSLVKKLRELYNRYPEKISFALEGLEHIKNELDKPLSEQINILSRAQSIFSQAFNKNFGGYRLLANALLPSYGQYNSDTIIAARQTGIKVIIGSKFNNSQGYTLLECDVAEIHPDNEASMVANWQPLKIKSPQELIKSMADALKKFSPGNPLVMIINAGILYNQLGKEGAKKYIDTLISLLGQIKEREKLRFMTSSEFYRKFIGGKQYIVLRLDDYQTPFKKELFEKVVNRITELNVPLTISIIPHKGAKLSEDPEAINYLNSMVEKGLIEVALHGYDHREGGEFTLSLNDQMQILRKALEESKKILSYDEIFSVVAPYDASNEFTSKAIKAVNKDGHNVRVFSSGFFGEKYSDKYMFGFDPEGIYHISRTIDPIKSWEPPYTLYSVEEILAAIGYDDAVLNIHPFRLETEERQNIILEVIKRLKKRPNIEFVTLRDFYFNINPTLRLGLTAWKYFKENTESSTGMVYSGILIDDNHVYRYPITTVWDIASSLLGIVSAERLGIISYREGIYRITRILDFLQECELYQNKYPNFDYDITTGQMIKEHQGIAWDDVARMLVALKVIETHYPSLEKRCNSVIERWDLTFLETLYQPDKQEKLNKIKVSPYWNYLEASFQLWGYKDKSLSFWTRLRNKIHNLFSQTQPDYFDRLLIPESYILEAIEMGQTEESKKVLQVIQNLQEARYKYKGIITCLSEGELDRNPWFVYCGMVITKEGFIFWPVVKSISGENKDYSQHRFISSRAAIGWQVLNENDYSRLCYDLIRKKVINHRFGFYTGIYEENEEINSSLSVNTNGIILESLWFRRRGKEPLIYPEERKVSPTKENIISRAKSMITDFYSSILEKLKVKTNK